MCTTALTLSFSVAENDCPFRERSAHAIYLDPVLSKRCCLITGWFKLINTSNLYLLAGIPPPKRSREAASKQERSRQACGPRHMLFNNKPIPIRQEKAFCTA